MATGAAPEPGAELSAAPPPTEWQLVARFMGRLHRQRSRGAVTARRQPAVAAPPAAEASERRAAHTFTDRAATDCTFTDRAATDCTFTGRAGTPTLCAIVTELQRAGPAGRAETYNHRCVVSQWPRQWHVICRI